MTRYRMSQEKMIEHLKAARRELETALSWFTEDTGSVACVGQGRLEAAQWALDETINLLE